MRFLPIVERELRVASRRRAIYWTRASVALTAMVAATWVFTMLLHEPQREKGQIIFYVLTGASLAYCWLAGLRSTADCLSEEKREGTLGLLFLTDLKGYDVVLGKLVASSLSALYGLLAVVPVLGIPLLLGGITLGEFGRVAAVLVNTLFFSLCVGLFASSLSKSVFKAMGATAVVLFICTGGLYFLWLWLSATTRPSQIHPAFYVSCPGVGFAFALDRQFAIKPEIYYWSLAALHGLAWFLLGLASLITPRAWQDRPVGARGLRMRSGWSRLWQGDDKERRRFRDGLLECNPFYWLASRPRFKPAGVWGVLVLALLIWLWGIAEGKFLINSEAFLLTLIALNSFFKGWVALEACRQLADDRRSGALELLLSTPLSVPEILRGQRLALQRQFLWPIILVLSWELLMLGYRFSDLGGDARDEFVMMCLVGIVIFIADVIALYWVGMWMGLVSQNSRRAFNGCILRIIALPWMAYAVFLMLAATAPSRVRNSLDVEHFLGVGLVLSLLFDVAFGIWARQKLLMNFRSVATQRFQVRRSLFQRVFGNSTASAPKPEA